jgi:hypothetical protein
LVIGGHSESKMPRLLGLYRGPLEPSRNWIFVRERSILINNYFFNLIISWVKFLSFFY